MSKYYRKTKRRNFIIAVMVICIIGMAIGYALFSSQLQITGTVAGSSHFKVYFIEAWVTDSSKGTATINTTEGSDRVTYNVTLNYPGDKCLVGTKIKNESSFRVKLNDFAVTAINGTPDIIFDYMPLDTTNEKLDVDGICDYRFTIEWDANSTNPNPGPVTFEIGLEYEQDPEDPLPDPSPSHNHGEGEIYTARFNPNGGTVSQSAMQITDGKKYGEMPTPERQEYTFLGWYTKLENGNLVTKDTIVDTDKDVTLYAIWNWNGHSMSHIDRIEPTCTEDGNIEYYQCASCNKKFSDASGENEILSSVVLPALGHNITYTARVEPTCEENGNIEYYKCTRCNKMFSDTNGENEITEVILQATGHNLSLVSKVDATCTIAGNNPYYTCSKCNNSFKDDTAAVQTTMAAETVAALGHNYTVETQSEAYLKTTASCTQNGVYYKNCSRCSVSSKNDTNVTFTTAKLPHTYTTKSQTATYLKTSAQCSGTGVQGEYYYKCANCTASSKGDTNTYYSTGTVAHNYNSKTTTATYKRSDATCQAVATYYYKCQWCSSKGSSYYSSGNKASHSYTANCSGCSGNGYTWKSTNANWYYCSTGNHCIVVNHCDTHNKTNLPGGYTAVQVCSKCGSLSTLYRRYSDRGSGKQCKWCGTAKK